MAYLIGGVIVAGIVTIIVIKRHKTKWAAESRYVCDVCGERDCICHKVED